MVDATRRKGYVRILLALFALLAPLSYGLFISHSAGALSISRTLDSTTSLVKNILRDPSPASIPADSPSTVQKPERTSQQPQVTHSSSAVYQQSTPVESQQTPVYQKLTMVTPINITWRDAQLTTLPQTGFMQTIGAPDVATDSTTGPLALRPTPQGWSLSGIMWYWWVLGLFVVILGVYIMLKRSHYKNVIVS